jgi:hypothetical protein
VPGVKPGAAGPVNMANSEICRIGIGCAGFWWWVVAKFIFDDKLTSGAGN